MRTPPRVEGALGQARSALERTVAWLDHARGRLAWLDVAVRVAERQRDANGSVLAGYLAYRMFLLVLPLVAILVALAGFDAAGSARSAESMRLGATVASTIAAAGADAERSRVPLLVVGLATFAIAAWGFLGALQYASAQAWRIPTRRFPNKSRAFLRLAGSLLLFGIVIYLSTLVRRAGIVAGLAGSTATLASTFVAYLGLGWILPRHSKEWFWLLPGALAGAVGHVGLQLAGTYYLPGKLAGASQTYGALGITLTIMTYLFLLGFLLSLSPMVNAVVWEHFQGEPPGFLRTIADKVPLATTSFGSGYIPVGDALDVSATVGPAGADAAGPRQST